MPTHSQFAGNAFVGCSQYQLQYYQENTLLWGVKFSVLVNDNGFPIDYAVTPTSVYNGDVALELLENSPFPIVYGDKGYVDRQTKENLICCGIRLISQLRKNMTGYSWFDNDRILCFSFFDRLQF